MGWETRLLQEKGRAALCDGMLAPLLQQRASVLLTRGRRSLVPASMESPFLPEPVFWVGKNK